MDTRVDRLIRSRLFWYAAMALAAVTILTGETAFRIARTSASQAVEINAARWSIHRLQLAAAELELSSRRATTAVDPTSAARFNAARAAMDKEIGALRRRYAENSDGEARQAFAQLSATHITRADELARAMKLHAAGALTAGGDPPALDAALLGASTAEPAVRTLLQHVGGSLREERSRFFDALTFGRWGVIVMTLAALVGLGAFRRASIRLHRQRESQSLAYELERERLESTVAQRTQDLRALTRNLQTAVEDERAALARELHDELGALLTAAKFDVATLRAKVAPGPEVEERIAHLNAMLNDGIALKRRIIENLRPSALDNLGLVAALEFLARETQQRLGIPVVVDLHPVHTSPEGALTLYRFVQEALTNVARHAQAGKVRVSLSSGEGAIRIAVHDDGRGFDPIRASPSAHGLSGMRFRVESMGGQMLVRSQAGDTLVKASIPAVMGSAMGSATVSAAMASAGSAPTRPVSRADPASLGR